jgi:hypothetical protein
MTIEMNTTAKTHGICVIAVPMTPTVRLGVPSHNRETRQRRRGNYASPRVLIRPLKVR